MLLVGVGPSDGQHQSLVDLLVILPHPDTAALYMLKLARWPKAGTIARRQAISPAHLAIKSRGLGSG